MGVLSMHRDVNPTISEKYIVTMSKASGSTKCPCLSLFATGLKDQNNMYLYILVQHAVTVLLKA